MKVHNRLAYLTICMAVTLDIMFGLLFAFVEHISYWLGLYYAVVTATTVGYGDITPHTLWGHVIAVLTNMTVVPLFAATFSLFTARIASDTVHDHLLKREVVVLKHIETKIEERFRHHLGST